MASTLKHFADPHLLLKTHYKSASLQFNTCDICQSKMAGLVGYRCSSCDFDIHEVCAGYFKQTVSFFAHPWHTLTLTCMPSSCVEWACDLCAEECPPGDFVYRCVGCMFDVHPLCTMLPQTVRCPGDPGHGICMVPAGQGEDCSACNGGLDVWRYHCGFCRLKLHIACASGVPIGGGGGEQGEGDDAVAAQTTSSAQSNIAARPRRRTAVAKFLLKASFRLAIDAATGGTASPVFDVLAAAWN